MLIDLLKADLIKAMKAGDICLRDTIRSLLSEIYKRQLDSGSKDAVDALCVSVITRAAKQRDESIDAYTKGNREDLAQKEAKEKAIIVQYLPAYITEEQTITKLSGIIATVPDKNFGKIMKLAKDISNINMSIVAGLVKKLI